MDASNTLRRLFAAAVSSAFHAINDNLGPPADAPPRFERALDPPHDETREVLHGRTVEDPFRPLEKIDAPETKAWTDRENKRFDDYMQGTEKTRAAVLDFFNKARPTSSYESMPRKRGDNYFVYRMTGGDRRPVLHVKAKADYGIPARRLVDPLKIDPSGKTNIVDYYPSPDGTTVAYRLSTSGSDKETLRFIDVATGRDMPLRYNNFRSSILWDDDGKGFHYMQSNPVTKSTSVLHHAMGTDTADDTVIYQPSTAETGASYFRLNKEPQAETGDYEWLYINTTERGKNALLARKAGAGENFHEVFPLKDGTLSPVAEVNGRVIAMTDVGAPNVRLVSFDINNPDPKNWQDVIPEDKADGLNDAFVWQGKIFATYRHDTGQQLRVFDLAGQHLHDVPVPPLSTFTVSECQGDDPTCLITFNNYQETGNIYKYDSTANQLALHRKSTTPIDLKDCIVERIQATSKDGTKVPMTVIRRKDVKLDGTAATLLYGYGGFNISQEPAFSTSIAQWVRGGGVYAIANLRGGGEYGKNWYDGGRGPNKQNVFDDFAACAEHLINNKYTTPKRLAIQGGSNGGLLTLATMLQRPELFGAVVSEVPVADMFRFHLGSYYGYTWKSDYGDPSLKEDFNTAAKYSPLHNVKDNVKHPPLLIKTDANDDRVLPWHSYKMAATLQSHEDPGSLTLLKIRTDGGHSAGMTHEQWCQDVATVRAFLIKNLGPLDQNEYKAQLTAFLRNKPPPPAGPKAA